MFQIKNSLIAVAIAVLAWIAAPVFAGEAAEVVFEDSPVSDAAAPVMLVASNTGANPAIAAVRADENTTGGLIVVTPPQVQDVLTQEALKKLDVVINDQSLEFAEADLQDVIRLIGKKLNINFIFDAGDIAGKVTLQLHNVRLRDALDSILSTRKLAIVADRSGIFRIVPKTQVGGKMIETKTEVVQLNWVSATDVQKSLKGFCTEAGRMEANEGSNALIITDVPPQIEIIKDLLRQIDKPERQVLLEARLADVDIEAVRNLGTQWSLTKASELAQGASAVAGASGDALSQNVIPQLLDGFAFNGKQGVLGFGEKVGVFGKEYNLSAVFTFLESRNVVQILANPRVTTLNNVPAEINIVERVPYIQASGTSSQGNSVPTVAFEDVGVDIKAKPIITPNGFVRMEIILKQTIFRGRVGTAALDPPLIDERNATTNVIVPDSNTVVLGGLRQVRQQEQVNGVPWMHEIPLLGWLFKDKQYDQSKIELVLMMTPRIVQDEVKLTDSELRYYNKIDNDWHLPDYFFDDVSSPLDETNLSTKKAAKASSH